MDAQEPAQPADEPLSPQARIRALTELRAQIDILRPILRDAQGRGLAPEEQQALLELTRAFEELAEAVRTLFEP